MQYFGAVVGVVVGLVLILVRKRFADAVVASQNAFWHFRFGERERKISELIVLLVGLGFLVFASFALLGVIRVKDAS